MLIYGASGHAKVIMDCLKSRGEAIKSVFDDNPLIKKFLGFKVVHSYDPDLFPGIHLVIAIGNNRIRKKIASLVLPSNPPPSALSHPSAILSENIKLGNGTVILHNAVVQTGTQIGNYVIINTGATVDHDCTLDGFVHVAPNATLCGGITVGEGTLIGAGSVVIPNIKIGKWCVIGAGAVVVKDVPDYSMVLGNPGKVVKKLK